MNNIMLSSIPLDELKTILRDCIKSEFSTHSKPSVVSEDELLTRKETARILGVSLVTLGSWVSSGKIISYRIGSRVRFKRTDVEGALQLRNFSRGTR